MKSRKTDKNETIINLLKNMSTDIKEYDFILKEQMKLISDINTVLYMQHTTNENFVKNNNELTKKCICLAEQLAEKNKVIDNLMKQIEEMKSARYSDREW